MEFLELFVLLELVPTVVIATICGFFFVHFLLKLTVRFATKKYNEGFVQSKRDFSILALFISQIVSTLVIIGLIILSAGYILFIGGLLFISAYFVSLITFLCAPYYYKTRIEKLYASNQSSVVLQEYKVGKLIKIIALGYFYFMTFSMSLSVLGISLNKIAVLTNSPNLLVLLDEGTRDVSYFKIAEKTQDVSICKKIKGPASKYRCYEVADPNYLKSLENCSLYAESGYGNPDGSQMRCVAERYIQDPFLKGLDVNCSFISKNFTENRNFEAIIQNCTAVQSLQDVIKAGDPVKCQGFLKERPLSRNSREDAYMGCLRSFSGTQEWEKACSLYKQGSGVGKFPGAPADYLLTEAGCFGYSGEGQASGVPEAFTKIREGSIPRYLLK